MAWTFKAEGPSEGGSSCFLIDRGACLPDCFHGEYWISDATQLYRWTSVGSNECTSQLISEEYAFRVGGFIQFLKSPRNYVTPMKNVRICTFEIHNNWQFHAMEGTPRINAEPEMKAKEHADCCIMWKATGSHSRSFGSTCGWSRSWRLSRGSWNCN